MKEHIKTGNKIWIDINNQVGRLSYAKDLKDFSSQDFTKLVDEVLEQWVSLSWLEEQMERKFKYPPYQEYTKESNKLMNDIFYEALKDVLSLLKETKE